MKRLSIYSGVVILALSSIAAQAEDKLTLQLKWVTQAQFAGYYVAKDKGFYKAEKLNVTIKPGGPDVSPAQIIAGRGADVIVDWMPSALAVREKGVPLVNIAQVFKRSGMMLTCRKDSGVETPADFKGHTLGVSFGGNEYPLLFWMDKLGYKTSGRAADIKLMKLGLNVDPLLRNQAACISTMSYNEYWQVIDAGMKPADLVVFKYEDEGVATLEDGLYTVESKLKDPAMVDKLARFLRAAMKGWDYAIKNQREAVKIVLKHDPTGMQTKYHQARMMGEIAKLIENQPKGIGYLEPTDFDRTVNVLLSGHSDPVITKKPINAWTHVIFDKAFGE